MPALDWKHLATRAVDLVLEAEARGGTGTAKRRRVVAQLAREVDDAATWGSGPVGRMMELLDGIAARLVLTAVVEGAVAGVAVARARLAG